MTKREKQELKMQAAIVEIMDRQRAKWAAEQLQMLKTAGAAK